MSPEQARGLPVDKRTDVWAFGCLLFEMLAGRRAFAGETVSETMTAVLEREPDWSGLPEETPQAVRRLLRRCLEKDPHRRLHDIADARIEIDDALAATDVPQPSTGSRVRKRVVTLASLVALSAGCVALGWWLRNAVGHEVSVPPVTRSTWTLPAGLGLDSPPAVSPDGKHVAFTAFGGGSSRRLFVRPFSSLEAKAIPGTEGAKHPFWSPDGRSLGYFAPGKADEGGDRRRRTGRNLRRDGWPGRHVEHQRRYRLLVPSDRLWSVARARRGRPGRTSNAARPRAGRELAPMARVPAGRDPFPVFRSVAPR